MRFSKNILDKEIVLECDKLLKIQAEWLLDLMNSLFDEKGNEIFKDGYKIQVGWTILTIRQLHANKFALLEPDFSTNPFSNLREDISCSLMIQAEQNDFTMKVGAIPLTASFQDKIIYDKSCLSEEKIYLERTPTRPNDSGWFIGSRNESNSTNDGNPNAFAACYVFDLLKLRPEVMKVLQLPAGYLVVFDKGEVEAVITPENESINLK